MLYLVANSVASHFRKALSATKLTASQQFVDYQLCISQ